MGASIDTSGGDRKSVNVELNIVPYIDLMSCLTAFLLVVAVWVDIAQITIEPKGRARSADAPIDPPPVISVLLRADSILVGVAHVASDAVVIPRAPGGDHWAGLEAALRVLHEDAELASRPLELAAESTTAQPLTYDDVVHAMDVAVDVGFTSVALTQPTGLSWRPTL